MNTRFVPSGGLQSFGALLLVATATASVNAYVHYRLSDENFEGAAFDAASEILYGINSQDGAIYRWQTATQQALDTINPPEKSRAVAVLPDADLAISAGSQSENDVKFYVWKLSDNGLIASIDGEKEEEFLAVSSDGRTCATQNGPVISLRALPKGERRARLTGHTRKPVLAMFSRDGRILASAPDDELVRLWDIERGQAIGTLDTTADVLLFSPDGRYLFTTEGKRGLVWDARSLAPVAHFSLSESVQGMAFSLDGLRLLVVDYGGIHQWKYDPAQFFSAGPATASDRLVMLSPTQKSQRIKQLPELTVSRWWTGFPGEPLVVSANSRWITTTSGKLWLYDAAALDVTESTTPRRVLTNPDREEKGASAIAISPDGRQLAAVGGEAVDLWEVKTGKHLGAWKNEIVFDRSTLSFSADNKLLAVTGWNRGDELVTVLEIARGQPVFTADDEFYKRLQKPKYETGGSGECPAVFGPGGTTIAWIGPWGNQVMLLDVAKRKAIGQLSDPTQVAPGVALRRDRTKFGPPYLISDGQVTAIAFSRDGQTLAAGYEGGMVKLWNAKTGKWLGNLKDSTVDADSYGRERGHEYKVIGVAFLPDGNVVSTESSCLKFWDAKTGALIKKLDGHFSSLSFSHDGQSFATGEIIWDRSAMRGRANLKDVVKGGRDFEFSPNGAYLAVSSGDGVVLIDGEPFEGLFTTEAISQDDVRWLGRTLWPLGYLNPEAKVRAAAYRSADVGHIALTLPQGAANDEIIVASIRDEVGPALAERLGPKIAIHLCTEDFQVERTIEVQRPLASTSLQSPPTPPALQSAAKPITATQLDPAPQNANDLDGAWRIEAMTVNGKPGKFEASTVYRYQDARLAVETDSAPSADFSCVFDTSSTPHGLDLALHRPEGDAIARMIYKVEGDVLTMCYGLLGTQRPTDFSSPVGSQRTLIMFRRVEDMQ